MKNWNKLPTLELFHFLFTDEVTTYLKKIVLIPSGRMRELHLFQGLAKTGLVTNYHIYLGGNLGLIPVSKMTLS